MSRELDAKVAEKVMGLEVYRSRQDWMQKGMPHIAEWAETVFYPAYWHPEYELATVVSNYSTDIKASFEVVEKLGEDGWIVTLHRDLKWFCDLVWFTADDTTWLPTTEADTLPEAICKAALKAVGEDATE